ncbi:hypothetical protein GQ607_006547, partial [Colletotrichum asianum]
ATASKSDSSRALASGSCACAASPSFLALLCLLPYLTARCVACVALPCLTSPPSSTLLSVPSFLPIHLYLTLSSPHLPPRTWHLLALLPRSIASRCYKCVVLYRYKVRAKLRTKVLYLRFVPPASDWFSHWLLCRAFPLPPASVPIFSLHVCPSVCQASGLPCTQHRPFDVPFIFPHFQIRILAGWFSVLPLTPPAAAFRHLHCAAPGTNHNIPSTQTILGSFHFQFQLLELQFPSRSPQPPVSLFNFALPSLQCFPGLVRSTLLWMRNCCIAGSESLACEHIAYA